VAVETCMREPRVSACADFEGVVEGRVRPPGAHPAALRRSYANHWFV